MRIIWQRARHLPTFIKGGAMAAVAGAPVYAAGCTFPWRETEQAWYWDAARADWFPVEPSLPRGRCYTHGITLDDTLLLLGGRKTTPEGRLSLRDAWRLHRDGGAFHWTQLPDMVYPRAIPTLGHAAGKVVALGGGEWERSQGGAFATRHLTNYEILDLAHPDRGWRDMGPLPFESLVGSAFATVGDSLYLFGGYTCWTEDGRRHVQKTAATWRYTVSTDTWTRCADFICPASGWCAAAYGDHIILLGGGLSLDLQGARAYYQTHVWLEEATPRRRLIASYSDLVFVYDTRTDTFTRLDDRLPIGNNDIRCTLIGDTLHVAGGETIDPALSNCSDAYLLGLIEP